MWKSLQSPRLVLSLYRDITWLKPPRLVLPRQLDHDDGHISPRWSDLRSIPAMTGAPTGAGRTDPSQLRAPSPSSSESSSDMTPLLKKDQDCPCLKYCGRGKLDSSSFAYFGALIGGCDPPQPPTTVLHGACVIHSPFSSEAFILTSLISS